MKPFDLVPTDTEFSRALVNFEASLLMKPVEKPNWWFYATHFRDEGQAAEEAGDPGLAMANDIFNSICWGALAEDSKEPLGEDVTAVHRNFKEGKESFEGLLNADGSPPTRGVHPVVRLRGVHYAALRGIYPTIKDAGLRARVADLLWLVQRDPKVAKEAIDAYLISSELYGNVDWAYGIAPLKRALRIERTIGCSNGPALQRAESELKKYDNGDLTYKSSFLMKTMLELRIGDARLCGALAEAAAKAAKNESDTDWHRAETYWGLAVQWHSKAKNRVAKEAALWSLARCYEKHATSVLSRPGQYLPYSHATPWLEQAVVTLRKINTPDAKSEAHSLHVRLVELQSYIPGEMPVSYHPVDLSDSITAARQRVTGIPLMEALVSMVNGYNPPSPRFICSQSYFVSRQTVFLARAPQVQLSLTGGAAARNTLSSNDEKLQKRERRRVRMIQFAHGNQQLYVQGVLIPALQIINNEHNINAQTFLPILTDSSFVLKGHEPLFAKGLSAGLRGDWLLSSHLLIPQIEAGFRAVLDWLGVAPPEEVVTGKREWGMQEFLLDDHCCSRLRLVFGEALLYDARILFVEKFGGNVRPHIAHGLLPQDAFASPYVWHMAYTWWLALRLCIDTLKFQASLPDLTDN